MTNTKFSDDFKRDAVAQITERGDPVKEVSERLGVSQHALHAWKKKFAQASSGEAGKDAEIRRLKRELARVAEERDILNRAGSQNSPGDCFADKGHRVFRQRCIPSSFASKRRPGSE